MTLKFTFKNLLIIAIVTGIFFSATISTISNVFAQTQGLVSVSPAFVELSPGQTYELRVNNTSSKDIQIIATPVLLKLENERIVPDELTFRQKLGVDADAVITIDSFNPIVEAGAAATLKINYLSSIENAFVGVRISSTTNEGSQINIGGDIISIILDKSAPSISEISTDLKVGNSFSIGNIYFTSHFKLTTVIENNSGNIYKPAGQVFVLDSEKRIGNISLTQKMNEYIVPGKTVEIENNYNDSRSLIDRVGNVKFIQVININGQVFEIEREIFAFPIELILFALVLLVFTYTGLRIFTARRLSIRPKKAIRRTHISRNQQGKIRIGERTAT
ncbi:MAG: hypothetical protein Kow0081_4410 [Candidatus Dojkabacteria bacterium]